MKTISVIGLTQSGKTTTIENIIRELTRRGYSVGTIKEIHYHAFKMDVEGTNTHRHKQAGAQLVTARGDNETDVLFQEKLPISKILQFYKHDYVIMEGVRDTSAAKIVTAHDIEGIEARLDDSVIAISGRIAAEMDQYKGLPVINAMTHIERLVDLIEEKSFLPISDSVELSVNGKNISLGPFIQRILLNAVEAIAKELDGYSENGDIELCIKR